MGVSNARGSMRLFAIPRNFQGAPFDKFQGMEQLGWFGKTPDQIVATCAAGTLFALDCSAHIPLQLNLKGQVM